MQGVVIQMNDEQFLTLAQLQAFLERTLAVDFQSSPKSITASSRAQFTASVIRA
jgi:hypothetical protein